MEQSFVLFYVRCLTCIMDPKASGFFRAPSAAMILMQNPVGGWLISLRWVPGVNSKSTILTPDPKWRSGQVSTCGGLVLLKRISAGKIFDGHSFRVKFLITSITKTGPKNQIHMYNWHLTATMEQIYIMSLVWLDIWPSWSLRYASLTPGYSWEVHLHQKLLYPPGRNRWLATPDNSGLLAEILQTWPLRKAKCVLQTRRRSGRSGRNKRPVASTCYSKFKAVFLVLFILITYITVHSRKWQSL